MMNRRSVLGLCFAAVVGLLLSPATGTAADKAGKKKARILFLTQSKGFQHGSVRRQKNSLAPAEIAMTQLGQQTGLFDVDCTQDAAADFTKKNLQNYDIVMFYTTGILPITDKDRDYFLNDWLKQAGHGWIGFHSAADTYRTNNPEHAWYWELCGGTFAGHPWGAGSTVTLTVHDPEHPAMQPFGNELEFKDEIYQYMHWEPKNVHVLMSINMGKTKIKKPYHVPVAWCRNWGDGKVFFNNLGHRNETWTDKRFLDSTENAIRWILGGMEGDATPNPDVSAAWQAKSEKDGK